MKEEIMERETVTDRRLASRVSNFLLTVVVPCFNEEDVIAATYKRISKALESDTFRLQIVFVNDGSVDATASILQEIAANDSRVKIITFSRNFGHQAAVSAGLAHSDGDVTAIIDADLQDPPEVILEMLARWADGYDIVYGVRMGRKEVFWKRLCYSLFYRMFRRLASIDSPLDAGDFSLIDKSALIEINKLPEKNRFFRGLRSWVGFKQIGVPYERDARLAGVTKYSFFKLVKLAKDGIFNFSTAPLTVVFYLGFVISTLSFLMLAFVLFLRITELPVFGMRAGDVQGFASIVMTVLFIGGVQLICIGVLGEYIGRIYQEVKARPTFIHRVENYEGELSGSEPSFSSSDRSNDVSAKQQTRNMKNQPT